MSPASGRFAHCQPTRHRLHRGLQQRRHSHCDSRRPRRSCDLERGDGKARRHVLAGHTIQRGVEPGRQARRYGISGQSAADLGCGERPSAQGAAWTAAACLFGGLQPGRRAGGRGGRGRWNCTDLGHRERRDACGVAWAAGKPVRRASTAMATSSSLRIRTVLRVSGTPRLGRS